MAYTIAARPAVELQQLPLRGEARDGAPLLLLRPAREQLRAVQRMLNEAIEDGDSYPYDEVMDFAAFEAYYLSHDAFVVVEGAAPDAEPVAAFYVKPNFPGRCSHICNAGFLVRRDRRGRGIGRFMAQAFLPLARALGYEAAFFNLVFTSNAKSLQLYKSVGFREVGRFPRAAKLRGGGYQDAVQLHYDLTALPPP